MHHAPIRQAMLAALAAAPTPLATRFGDDPEANAGGPPHCVYIELDGRVLASPAVDSAATVDALPLVVLAHLLEHPVHPTEADTVREEIVRHWSLLVTPARQHNDYRRAAARMPGLVAALEQRRVPSRPTPSRG